MRCSRENTACGGSGAPPVVVEANGLAGGATVILIPELPFDIELKKFIVDHEDSQAGYLAFTRRLQR